MKGLVGVCPECRMPFKVLVHETEAAIYLDPNNKNPNVDEIFPNLDEEGKRFLKDGICTKCSKDLEKRATADKD